MIYFLTVNYYSTSLITRLIKSFPSQYKISYQIVIVNNSPEDHNLKQLDNDNIQILEAKRNLGFGQACNLGLNWIYQQDLEGIVWIINPDTYLLSNTLERVPEFFAAHPEISLLGTLIYTPNHDIWFAGGRFIPYLGAIFATDLLSSHPEREYVPCDWISGCSLLINLCNFSSCPQFAPEYFLYYEDFDFCRRYASEGHQIAVTARLAVVHEPSSITNRNVAEKLKHSTYSYLLTLAKYANPIAFFIRFWRLIFHAFFLLGIKPQIALGKLVGVYNYLNYTKSLR